VAGARAVVLIAKPDGCVLGLTDTAADALWVGAATLVAVTVTVVAALTEGAVNNPVSDTVPALADQVTAVWLVPLTLALNCCEPREITLAPVGEIVTVIEGLEPLTVIQKRRSPRSVRGRSVTKTTKEYVPAAVGVPVSAPVEELIASPGGSAPRMTVN